MLLIPLRRYFFLIFIIIIVICRTSNSQVVGEHGKKLEAIVNSYHKVGLFQGAVLVAMDDGIIYRGAVGMSNVELSVPNTPETRFTIASLGKAFTAAIVLQLREEGLLSLDDSIGKHLSGFQDDVSDKVTIHHLLSHTAGIPWPQDAWEPEQFAKRYTLSEIVEPIKKEELIFEPGTEFNYCNSCYHLLASIIETLTGSSFESELRQRILDPLGMPNTGIAYADTIFEFRASGYERAEDGTLSNALLQDQSYALGAGGMYSTIDDLYQWHLGLAGSRILSDESKALMFKSGMNGAGYGWAIGAYVKIGVEGTRKLALGYGGTSGFASGLAILLDDSYFIVFLGNVRQVPQNDLMNDLWNTILGLDVKLVENR